MARVTKSVAPSNYAQPNDPALRRWWVLPLVYVIFIAYQSLVGQNIWNCGRELTSPFLEVGSRVVFF